MLRCVHDKTAIEIPKHSLSHINLTSTRTNLVGYFFGSSPPAQAMNIHLPPSFTRTSV
jgi:hypothetical protein